MRTAALSLIRHLSYGALYCCAAAIGVASLAGCAAHPPKVVAAAPTTAPAAPAAHEKTPLEEYMERESTGLGPQQLASPDGVVKVRVSAKGEALIKKGENLYEVNIPIGSATPLDCLVFLERPDPAAKLHALLGTVFSKFKSWEISNVDAGEVGGNPFLHTEVTYVYDEGGQEKVGYLKVRVLPLRQSGILCMHDEPGYRRTFTDAVKEFAASLEIKTSKPVVPALYNEIQTISLGKQRVGFEQAEVMAGDKGKKTTLVFTSMLVPRSPTEFLATDEASFESGSADGLLERGVFINVEQGEIKYELTLEGTKVPRHYKVTGKFGGQPLEASFTATELLRDGRGQAALVAKTLLAAGGANEVSYLDYAPGVDPRNPTPVTVHKPDASKGQGDQYTIQAGPARLKGSFDEHGHLKQSTLSMGAVDFTMERVFVEGTP